MNLRPAIKALENAGVADPAGDVRRLFDWAYAQGSKASEPQDRDAPNTATLKYFETAMAARVARKPVSQITENRSFWRHDFRVTKDVLDPRPDTETLIEQALIEPFLRVLDLGTGSGCIVISLLADRPGALGVGVDISGAALSVAQSNADRIGVTDRLTLAQSDWFSDVSGRYDLIVSNPPYIAQEEMPLLAPEVRNHEPAFALTDGADGLTAYRIIAQEAAGFLVPAGRVLVEIGPTQAQAVASLFETAGFTDIKIHKDIDQRDRVIAARRAQ